MSGRRNSRDGMEDSPMPTSARRTRSRGAASPSGAQSPSIAPLSENRSGAQTAGASPSVGQPRQRTLQPIAELSPSQQRPTASDAIASQNPSMVSEHRQQQQAVSQPGSLPMRSPSAGYPRGLRSPSARDSQQRVPQTPGTAHRHVRPDLAAAPQRPMVTVSEVDIPEIEAGDATATAPGSTTVIWGTTINAEVLRTKVDHFLWNFKDPQSGQDKYTQLIAKAARDHSYIVNLDTSDLRVSDPTLYKWLVAYPHEVLPIFDRQGQAIAIDILAGDGEFMEGDEALTPDLIFRPFKLAENRTIRDLNPADIDKLICVEGMVTRTSNVIPDLRVAHFSCAKCGHETKVTNEGGKVDEPSSCPHCKTKSVFVLVHNMCTFSNKQLIKMQEKPNDIPEGETPHALVLHAFEANVDICRPGDRVAITGILRALPIRVNPTQRTLHALFKTYIDVLHVDRNETSRLFAQAKQRGDEAAKKQAEAAEEAAPGGAGARASGGAGAGASSAVNPSASGMASQNPDGVADPMDVTDGATDTLAYQYVDLGNETPDQVQAKEDRIKALAADPKIYERLVASLAPNVWEMDDVKKGLLCQLFGGTCKKFPGGRIRGELNVLMVGDPSVSKSQLLSYVHAVAPRGIYTSGRGSSAVGLTAYVTKDPETKEMVLESGALVLSDRGVCCIDEFDKMGDAARSMLHEAMEQQTVSVAKAGLISTLNARTSVCACANPIGSRYNPGLTLAENINLPPTLLTRFDLIYLILDKCEEERDRRLARHLVSLFHEHPPVRQQQDEVIPKEELKEYIAFARTRIEPKLSDEATEELVTAYSRLRSAGRDKKVVVATPRQLESLIRLSEALARMRLDTLVTKKDVEEAVRLWYTAMQGSAGCSDGSIDMDNIFTGASTAARQAQRLLPEDLRVILTGPNARPISSDDLFAELQRAYAASGKPAVTRQQMLTALRQVEEVVIDERTGVIKPRGSAATA